MFEDFIYYIAIQYRYIQFLDFIYTIWQKMLANHFERLYVIIAIYTNWQKCKANLLKFKHTIIDNYRCKIE